MELDVEAFNLLLVWLAYAFQDGFLELLDRCNNILNLHRYPNGHLTLKHNVEFIIYVAELYDV